LKTAEQGRREEISDGNPGSGEDPDGAGGGVLALLGRGFPSGEGEHSCLMPLWSSINGEQRAREGGDPRANQGKEWEMVLGGERMRYL
jgi:hypothetical protein